MPSRLRRTIAPLAASVALAVGVGATGAPAAQGATNGFGTFTLSGPAEVVEDRPFRVTYSATGSLHAMYVYARPTTAGATCAPTHGKDGGEGDLGTLISGWGSGAPFTTPVSEEVEDSYTPEDPGAILVCGYARQAGNGSMVLPESLVVPVRGARAAVAVVSPDHVTAGRSVRVDVSGTSEARRPVSAAIVAGDACPAPGGDEEEAGPGPFERNLAVAVPEGAAGPGRLCVWVTDGDEIEAVDSRPIRIDPAPGPPPPTCATVRALCPPPPPCPTTQVRLASGLCVTPPRKLAIDARRTGRNVSGTVTAGPAGTRLVVTRRGSWTTVAQTRPRPDGTFRVRVPARHAKRALVVRLWSRANRVLLSRGVKG